MPDNTLRDSAGVAITSTDATSLPAAQANQLASSRVTVAILNANLKSNYLSKFADWKISVDAGKAPNTGWPLPPKAWVVGSPDAAGFQYPVVGPDPVCAVPDIPEDHTQSQSMTGPQSGLGNPPGTMVLGVLIPGTSGIYSALPGDTCKEGTTKTIPGPSGTLLTLRKHNTPWGGYWETVSN